MAKKTTPKKKQTPKPAPQPAKTKAKDRPIAVILSDCHLVDGPKLHDSLVPFRYGVQKALQRKLPLILAGDVLDVNVQRSEVVSQLRKLLTKLTVKHKLPCYYVQGQHEGVPPGQTPWISAVAPGCVHLTLETSIPLGSWRLRGVDCHSPALFALCMEHLQAKLNEKCEPTILVAHQLWDCLLGKSMVVPTALATSVPEEVALVITGDYHKAVRKVSGETRFMSPGAGWLTAIDQPEAKYGWVLYDDLNFKRFRLPTRPVVRIPKLMADLDSEDYLKRLPSILNGKNLKDQMAALPAEIRAPLISVHCNAEISADSRRQWQRALEAQLEKGEVQLHWREFVIETAEEALEAAATRRKVVGASLPDCLFLAVNQEEDPELHADLVALTSDPDPAAAVNALWQAAVAKARELAVATVNAEED